MRTSSRRFLSAFVHTALAVPFILGAVSCASSSAGTGEVTAASGEPVRVPVMIINNSLTRADVTVAGTVVGTVLPSSRSCVLLPSRVDNQDLRFGSYTIIRQVWSSQPGWQVTVPDTNTAPRLNAMAAAPCS